MVRASVYIVEDELIVAEDIRATLVQQGYAIAGNARTGENALEDLTTSPADIVLMDIQLAGDLDGIETAGVVRDRFRLPVIFLTAHADERNLERAKIAEPYGYLLKPFDERELRSAIEMALYKHRMEEQAEEQARIICILANAVTDPIAIVDGNGKAIARNDAMANRLGTRSFSDCSCPPPEIEDPDLPERLLPRIGEANAAGHPIRFVEGDGERWSEITVSPLPGAGSGPENPWFLVHCHDITDLRRIEEEIRSEGIARLEHNMEQFQILNDQIRNPLQAIMGYVTLESDGFRDRIIEQIRIIDRLVTRLDQGWVESEKVRQFLLRHYYAGQDEERNGDP